MCALEASFTLHFTAALILSVLAINKIMRNAYVSRSIALKSEALRPRARAFEAVLGLFDELSHQVGPIFWTFTVATIRGLDVISVSSLLDVRTD